MLKFIRALLSGKQDPASMSGTSLPPELQTLIAAAYIIERSGPEEGISRILVQTALGVFWANQATAWLESNWPELNSTQISRAETMLSARIKETMRESAFALIAGDSAHRWRDWKPAPRLWKEVQ